MDTRLLRVFQRQILTQCRFILRAADDMNRALAANDVTGVFYGIQNLLNASANVSKAMWGAGGKLEDERKPVRESIGVAEDSPLREVTMRNNFEHLDERLERWWEESGGHVFVDLNVAGREHILGVDPLGWFRNFDPRTTDITFWGEDFNAQEIVDEVTRLLPRIETEADKPLRD